MRMEGRYSSCGVQWMLRVVVTLLVFHFSLLISMAQITGQTLDEVIVDFLGCGPAVAPDEHETGVKEFGEEVSYFVGCFLVEIDVVDSADVISVKSSHNNYQLVLVVA